MENTVNDLLDFIKFSATPYHTVKNAEEMLLKAGFKPLAMTDKWELSRGQGYYTKIYGSALIAFTAGKGDFTGKNKLRLACAHTDFPCLRLKPAASMEKGKYGILNIETYGGLILNSWLDRPLSLAGKVVLKGNNPLEPETRLIDLARPLVTIPNLAIHMNRKVNEGIAIKKQKDILPLAAVLGEEKNQGFFADFLAREMDCQKENVLSYELSLYPYEAGCQLGLNGELISSPRLDNLTSVVACLKGIISAREHAEGDGLSIIALFDNEEIGSRTKQGANSGILLQILERIYSASGYSREEMWQAVNGGFMLSVDVAHGLHPDYMEKADPTNRPVLNGGVVLKQAASQAYAGDAEAVAIIAGLCQQEAICYQQFVNNNDIPGGSTLGSMASALVPMRAMDIGVPILAMHSARETMGARDQEHLNNLLQAFFMA